MKKYIFTTVLMLGMLQTAFASEYSLIYKSFKNRAGLGSVAVEQLDANVDGFSDYLVASSSGFGLQLQHPESQQFTVDFWEERETQKAHALYFNNYHQLCGLSVSGVLTCYHGATYLNSLHISLGDGVQDFVAADLLEMEGDELVVAYQDRIDIYTAEATPQLIQSIDASGGALAVMRRSGLQSYLIGPSGVYSEGSDGMQLEWEQSFAGQVVATNGAVFVKSDGVLTKYGLSEKSALWQVNAVTDANLIGFEDGVALSSENAIYLIDSDNGSIATTLNHTYSQIPSTASFFNEFVAFPAAEEVVGIDVVDAFNGSVLFDAYSVIEVQAFYEGDYDMDGRTEWLMAVMTSEGASLFAMDEITQMLTYRTGSDFFEGKSITSFKAMKIAQLDSDEQMEIVIAANTGSAGVIVTIDTNTMAPVFRGLSYSIESFETADFDIDQKDELVAALSNKRVYVMTGLGVNMWNSGYLEDSRGANYDMFVVDANYNGYKEIYLVSNGVLHRVNARTKKDWHTTQHSYRSFTALDVDDDNWIELIAGTADGRIVANDGKDLDDVEKAMTVCNTAVVSLDAVSDEHIAYACTNEIGVVNLRANQVVWSQSVTANGFGKSNTMVGYQMLQIPHIMVASDNGVEIYKVSANNTPPEPQSLLYSVHWRGSLNSMVLAEDDTYFVEYKVTSLPESGRFIFTDQKLGAFFYEPEGTYTGDRTFEYTASDAIVHAEPIQSTIKVTNNPPLTMGERVSVHWKKQKQIQLSSSDVDQDPIVFSIVEHPDRGELIDFDPVAGTVTYIADGEGSGSTYFSFKTNDGPDDSDVAKITITLENSKPVAHSAEYVSNGQNPTIQKLTGEDDDGDEVTFRITSLPGKGSVALDEQTNEFSYTPDVGAEGFDTFGFVANDGESDSVEAMVKIVLPGIDESEEEDEAGSMEFLFILMLSSLLMIRIRKKFVS